jgi:hypothetical protein
MDDPELKQTILDTHRMVTKLYKYQKRQNLFRVLKTIVILVIIVGAYYAILPVFEKVLNTYNSLSNGVSNIQNINFPWSGNEN